MFLFPFLKWCSLRSVFRHPTYPLSQQVSQAPPILKEERQGSLWISSLERCGELIPLILQKTYRNHPFNTTGKAGFLMLSFSKPPLYEAACRSPFCFIMMKKERLPWLQGGAIQYKVSLVNNHSHGILQWVQKIFCFV